MKVKDNIDASGIYAILNRVNGRKYIGSAKRMRHRRYRHLEALVANKHHSRRLQNAWNKYGADAFEWVVIELVPDISQLIAREQAWMDVLKSAEQNFGYNISPTAGSPLGTKHTPEARAKMSAKAKGKVISLEAREKMSASGRSQFRGYNKGKVMSDEQKAKTSASLRGRVISEEHKLKLREGVRRRIIKGLSPEEVEFYDSPEQTARRAQKREWSTRTRRNSARTRLPFRSAKPRSGPKVLTLNKPLFWK